MSSGWDAAPSWTLSSYHAAACVSIFKNKMKIVLLLQAFLKQIVGLVTTVLHRVVISLLGHYGTKNYSTKIRFKSCIWYCFL